MNHVFELELHKFFNSPVTCIVRCTRHSGKLACNTYEERDVSAAFDVGASAKPVTQVAFEFRFPAPQRFRASEPNFARLRAYGVDPCKVAALCDAALRRSLLCRCSLSGECDCDIAVIAAGHEIELSVH